MNIKTIVSTVLVASLGAALGYSRSAESQPEQIGTYIGTIGTASAYAIGVHEYRTPGGLHCVTTKARQGREHSTSCHK